MSWGRVGVLSRLFKEETGVLARTPIKRGIWEGSRAPSLPASRGTHTVGVAVRAGV